MPLQLAVSAELGPVLLRSTVGTWWTVAGNSPTHSATIPTTGGYEAKIGLVLPMWIDVEPDKPLFGPRIDVGWEETFGYGALQVTIGYGA